MTIKAGDLVVCIKGTICCGNNTYIGRIFRVEGVINEERGCFYCGTSTGIAERALLNNGSSTLKLSRLIKIDPPSLQDNTEQSKELEISHG